MVLKEIEHVRPYAFDGLPARCQVRSRKLVAFDSAQGIVEVYFIVEVIESRGDERTIESHVVDFGYETDIGIVVAYGGNSPLPELEWHHVHHIAAEAVDSFGGPIAQYV